MVVKDGNENCQEKSRNFLPSFRRRDRNGAPPGWPHAGWYAGRSRAIVPSRST
jgi:hypothetical protein